MWVFFLYFSFFSPPGTFLFSFLQPQSTTPRHLELILAPHRSRLCLHSAGRLCHPEAWRRLRVEARAEQTFWNFKGFEATVQKPKALGERVFRNSPPSFLFFLGTHLEYLSSLPRRWVWSQDRVQAGRIWAEVVYVTSRPGL